MKINKSIYSPEEQLYLILEIRKVFENHRNIPTMFIYPTKRLTFSGIYFKDKTKEFLLTKESIEDTWKVKIEESSEFIDLNSTSIYESLYSLYAR